jgi:hypothetical protein
VIEPLTTPGESAAPAPQAPERLDRADHLEMLLALEQERAARLQVELLEARLAEARNLEAAAAANRARAFARVWKKYNLARADQVDPEGNIKRSFP